MRQVLFSIKGDEKVDTLKIIHKYTDKTFNKLSSFMKVFLKNEKEIPEENLYIYEISDFVQEYNQDSIPEDEFLGLIYVRRKG